MNTNPVKSNIIMPNCFAVILAGGENLPRQHLVPKLLRGGRPPQFLRRAGGDFLVNQTRKQVETAFPADKSFITVTEADSKYYEDVLADVPPQNLIIQPQDDGTTFEILYTAMRFAKVDPRTVLAFFPMDFSASDDKLFINQVEAACLAVKQKPRLILMGIEPENSDPQMDWIEIDQQKSADSDFKLWKILHFWDNPAALSDEQIERGRLLLKRSVKIGTTSTFLRKIRRAAPDIYARFAAIQSKIGTSEEEKAIRDVYYAHLSLTDFSNISLTLDIKIFSNMVVN